MRWAAEGTHASWRPFLCVRCNSDRPERHPAPRVKVTDFELFSSKGAAGTDVSFLGNLEIGQGDTRLCCLDESKLMRSPDNETRSKARSASYPYHKLAVSAST